MKKAIRTLIILFVIVPLSQLSAAITSEDRAWINEALGARPTHSGSGVIDSTGNQIDPSDFLWEGNEKERSLTNQARSAYGDDQALIGAAEEGANYLMNQGADTEPGIAFEIVNQDLDFGYHYQPKITHNIYEHTVIYEDNLLGPLTSPYHQVSWVDLYHYLDNASEGIWYTTLPRGGGPDFYTTPIPVQPEPKPPSHLYYGMLTGRNRNYTALLAAPVLYSECSLPKITVTGGTAWVPGCNRNDARCERVITYPQETSLYRHNLLEERSAQYADRWGQIHEYSQAPAVVGQFEHGIFFPPYSDTYTTHNPSQLRATIGVRKIEASGFCPHPEPSTDVDYINSLPDCTDPDLTPGQECGSVEQVRVDGPSNIFQETGVNFEFHLNQMMQDCQIITEDVSDEVLYTKTNLEFCGKSQEVSFPGCTVTQNHRIIENCTHSDPSGLCDGNMDAYDVITQWEGTERCLSLLQNVGSYGSECSYTLTQNEDPNCFSISGFTVCKGSYFYDQLKSPPGEASNKFSPVTISDVNCDPFSSGQTVEEGGFSMELEPYDSCTSLEQNESCTLIDAECVSDSESPLGSWCTEYEYTYQCQEVTKRVTKSEQTRMVCGNQEFYCADGSCLDQQETLASEGFARAAAMLSAVQGIASHAECDDPTMLETCRVFNGKAQACRRGKGVFARMWDCCDLTGGKDALAEGNYIEAILQDGVDQVIIGPNVAAFFDAAKSILQFIMPCHDHEVDLATSREIDAAVYLGSYCGRHISVGFARICIRNDRSFCAWPTALGKVIMEQARPMFSGGFGDKRNPDCRGLTILELEDLDWSQIDLTEWANKLIETDNLPKAGFGEFGDDPSIWAPEFNPGNIGYPDYEQP